MRVGVKAFRGDRLQEGREARGYTRTKLAAAIDVSRKIIDDYERGVHQPSSEVVSRLVEELDLPIQFFLKRINRSSQATPLFRSLRSTTQTARRRALVMHQWTSDIATWACDYVTFPQPTFPVWHAPDDPGTISDDDIEELAQALRRFWNLGEGPLPDLVGLFERNGGVVAFTELGPATDGLGQWHDGKLPVIVLGQDKHVPARSRFDVAHEIGHLLLHRSYDLSAIDDERELKAITKKIERQAHRFAGAFLVPARPFAFDVVTTTLDSFIQLKAKYRVSIAALIHRAEDLGIITSERARQLWINYSSRGWRSGEPLDDVLAREEPQLLNRSISLILENQVFSKAGLIYDLALAPKDIEVLCGLPRGFLDSESDKAPDFTLELRRPKRALNEKPVNGTVLPFTRSPRSGPI